MTDDQQRCWYAICTRPRHEKRVRDVLVKAWGIESFLPLWEQRKQWRDRIKTVATPLFPGYCFACFLPSERHLVFRTSGVTGIVAAFGRIEPVALEEIDAIRILLNHKTEFHYEPTPFIAEGEEVEVIRGPLTGLRGIRLRGDDPARLILRLSLICQAVAVDGINIADVTPIPRPSPVHAVR